MDVEIQKTDPTPPRTFQCGECPKKYLLQKRLHYHMKVHRPDNPHVCPLCNKGWAFAFQLTHHMRGHIGEKLFKCPADGCPKEFARQNGLKAHMHMHSDDKSELKVNCTTCGKTLMSQRSLKYHIWKYHNNMAPQRHPCATCGNEYQTRWGLTKHLQSHLPEDPQSCPVCGKSFLTGLRLKQHLKRHDLEGTFKCEQCLRPFKTKRTLEVHIGHAHDLQKYRVGKDHPCSLCGRQFLSTSDLARHLKTHTGEKPIQDPTCPKESGSKCDLQSHNKIHVVGDKAEECQFCGRSFALESSLAFHLPSHTGEKPFQCPICPKAFASKVSVRLHIKQHTGRKPSECQFCGRMFLNTNTSTSSEPHRGDPLEM